MPLIRNSYIVLVLLFLVGCDVEVKVKLGGSEKLEAREKPWQVYATNKRTQNYELWWSNHDSRDDCLKSLKYDLSSSIHEPWQGCVYVGSDNRYVLYLMNRWYESDAFFCVAKLKNPGETKKEFTVVVKGAPKETEYYRCVLPE